MLRLDCRSEMPAHVKSYMRPQAKPMKLPPIEAVAAKVHEAWMEAKLAQGITSRKSESGEELMVDYALLSESAKELDRASVRAVYSAIESLSEKKTT